MIRDEILSLKADSEDSGAGLNAIVDEFRGGRRIREIFALLSDGDAELVSVGVWILYELPFESYATRDFIERLYELVEHYDARVRFGALGALFPALRADDQRTKDLLKNLRDDPDEGVRMSADAAAARLFGSKGRRGPAG